MARSKNRNSRQGARVAVDNANTRVLHHLGSKNTSFPTSLSLYEDRRQWHPEGARSPARSFSHPRHRLQIAYKKSYIRPASQIRRAGSLSRSKVGWGQLLFPTAAIAFKSPSKVLVCVRRKIRKEVLHAKRVAGRSGLRAPRYVEYSSIRCS